MRGDIYDARLSGLGRDINLNFNQSDSVIDLLVRSDEKSHQTSIGEFDPGSGRTLAACLTHASQGDRKVTGERVRNT